jgi:hypothetical protein
MTDWLFFLIILAMPWKSDSYAEILDVPVVWSNARCHGGAAACYYDDTIYLKEEWRTQQDEPELRRAIIHELQHHFQCKARVWQRPGGWGELLEVGRVLAGDDWRNHPHELHAELPWILKGMIPPPLQSWYTWFEVVR